MSLLPALRSRHTSVNWDVYGRCEDALCSTCGDVVGVSTQGRLLQHGPKLHPCRGSGGDTTVPVQTPGNARQSLIARNHAMAGVRLPRGKR